MEGGNGLKCLRCSAPIDAEFGIVACTQCGAVMMVDMDGQLQLADEPAATPPEEPIADFASSSAETAFGQEAAFEPEAPSEEPEFGFQNGLETVVRPVSAESESAEEPSIFGKTVQDFESPVDEGGAEPAEASFVTEEVSSETESAPEPESPASNENWFDQGLEQSLSPATELPAAEVDPKLASPDFSDVASFGNQDADAGALQFELILSGLDHADLRRDVFEVLSDPRFFLNVRELREQLQQGILTIPGLSAARTSLLVSRLRHLKVNIQWRQKLYDV